MKSSIPNIVLFLIKFCSFSGTKVSREKDSNETLIYVGIQYGFSTREQQYDEKRISFTRTKSKILKVTCNYE